MESLLKLVSGRQRPNYFEPSTREPYPRLHGPLYKPAANTRRFNNSFPSGHTTVAFSAATVYAMEYSKCAVVPIVAYSAATLIGPSRHREQALGNGCRGGRGFGHADGAAGGEQLPSLREAERAESPGQYGVIPTERR
ncbi:MAG: phosphatase family protein [Flaviaesturariibacter sp.]|nr:phosphatase family protein [Flaviaesturariibacter sp.]